MASQSTAATREADRAHLAELDCALRKLLKKRKRVQTRLDAYRYPVLTLPYEILSEIFTHFLPEYPLCAPTTGLLSPIQLTHICRQWRDMALSTPTLWRAISISLNSNEMVEMWLARSRSCPVSIEMTQVWDSIDEFAMKPLIQAILSYCNRWEHLNFVIPHRFLPLCKGSMPFLRDLRIRLLSDYSQPALVFQDAPRLSTITLPDSIPRQYRMHNSHCWELLEGMPNLLHCRLGLFGFNSVLPDRHLARLESLALSLYKAHNTPLTPLRQLRIPETFLSPDPVGTLVAFVARSGCKLEEVYITGGDTFANEYRKAIPTLVMVETEAEQLITRFSRSVEQAVDLDIDTGSDDDEKSVENEPLNSELDEAGVTDTGKNRYVR
ncbi:hypothetical protein B0H11DRAFT_1998416 [Mycena galericulata]|nr:hypothetical protein B0H11DRAFT_1998416 [Mycena galericulata]